MLQYNFSVDKIEIRNTRSRHEDTVYISASVAVAGRQPVTITKRLGDHNNGSFDPGIRLNGVPVADDEIAVFTYVIINNGHTSEKDVLSKLKSAAVAISERGADAAIGVAKDALAAAIGAAIGGLIGTSFPVLGTILGTALGALAGSLLGDIADLLNPNCDGPLGSGVNYVIGRDLREKLETGGHFGQTDHNVGVDSAAGCGSNSDYYTTWSIKKA